MRKCNTRSLKPLRSGYDTYMEGSALHSLNSLKETTMTSTAKIQPRFEAATESDLAPADTYICVYAKEVDGQMAFHPVTRELRTPVHPSKVVNFFSGLAEELGLGSDFGAHIKGVNFGHQVTYAPQGSTPEEMVNFASNFLPISNTKRNQRAAKRVYKGFSA